LAAAEEDEDEGDNDIVKWDCEEGAVGGSNTESSKAAVWAWSHIAVSRPARRSNGWLAGKVADGEQDVALLLFYLADIE
jgi:hypothetical protein